MRITVENIEAAREAAEEFVSAAEEWLDMQESRADFDAEEIADARSEMDDMLQKLKDAVK
jgi:hypothetical protein